MEKKGIKYLSWIAIIAAVLVTSYFAWIILSVRVDSTFVSHGNYSVINAASDTAFGGIFSTTDIDASLPYYRYKKIEDSLKSIKEKRDFINNSTGGEGRGFGYLGLTSLPLDKSPFDEKLPDNAEKKALRDSLDKLSRTVSGADSVIMHRMTLVENKINAIIQQQTDSAIQAQKKTNVYYLTLSDFNLDPDVKFFIANHSYNLAYVKWDTVNGSRKEGHYERKPINVRYSASDKKLLIPISKKQYDVIDMLMRVVPLLFIFFCVYIFIGIPLQVIINISRGKAFIRKNIRHIQVMGFTLLAITVLQLILPGMINYFLRADIPAEFEFRRNLLTDPSPYIQNTLFAIGLIITSVAFKKGYKLQKEQELTV